MLISIVLGHVSMKVRLLQGLLEDLRPEGHLGHIRVALRDQYHAQSHEPCYTSTGRHSITSTPWHSTREDSLDGLRSTNVDDRCRPGPLTAGSKTSGFERINPRPERLPSYVRSLFEVSTTVNKRSTTFDKGATLKVE